MLFAEASIVGVSATSTSDGSRLLGCRSAQVLATSARNTAKEWMAVVEDTDVLTVLDS